MRTEGFFRLCCLKWCVILKAIISVLERGVIIWRRIMLLNSWVSLFSCHSFCERNQSLMQWCRFWHVRLSWKFAKGLNLSPWIFGFIIRRCTILFLRCRWTRLRHRGAAFFLIFCSEFVYPNVRVLETFTGLCALTTLQVRFLRWDRHWSLLVLV